MLKDKHLEIILRYLHPEWDYIDISGDEYKEFADAVFYLLCDYYRNKNNERIKTEFNNNKT